MPARLIGEREHVVALRFLPPQFDQLLEPLRFLGREVGCLREVVGDAVQLPLVLVERSMRVTPVVRGDRHRVEHHRLPAVVIHRP